VQLKKHLYTVKQFLIKIFIGHEKQKRKIELRKFNNWYQLLNENYSHIVDKYIQADLPITSSVEGYKIWVMWWQGEDNMPEIIRLCYLNLIKNANHNEVILIHHKNYQNYITLPDYIIDKVENEVITITHLSDLIRAILLSEYGGLWIDATILVTKPLPLSIEYPYWSTKWALNPSEYHKYKLWVGLWTISDVPKLTISQCMGIWYSVPQNPIFKGLKDFWLSYWANEDLKPYYWTTELFLIGIMRKKIGVVKQMMDNVPINNSKLFDFKDCINEEFDIASYDKLLKDTSFFYLSWKEKYLQFDPQTNQITFFGYLQKQLQYEK
jgi:hypothetical protein